MKKTVFYAAIAIATLFSVPAQAATERMPCKYTEAKVTTAGTYLWVACPGEGRLMPEGMEVHFQGDKRDFVIQSMKLVALDGPLGGSTNPSTTVSVTVTYNNGWNDALKKVASTLPTLEKK